MVLACLGVLIFGGLRYYLRSSGLFQLREARIVTGDTLGADLVSEYLSLSYGMPLFALDLARRQQEFMRDAPTIQTITIQRHLPDRMSVTIVERMPLARFARRNLALDAEGFIFVRYKGIDQLPSISGYEIHGLTPGARVSGLARSAILLLELMRVQNIPLTIADIDVSREGYLICTMADQRMVKLAWEGVAAGKIGSQSLLRHQLMELARSMNSETGRVRGRWDATVPGRAYAL